VSIADDTSGLPLVDTQPLRCGVICGGYFFDLDEAREAERGVREADASSERRRLLTAATAVVYWSQYRR